MKRLGALLVFVLTLTACGSPAPADLQTSDIDTAELMALALTDLVTENHTFGQGPPPFTEYLIEVNTVPIDLGSGDAQQMTSETRRPLTHSERTAIESAISEFGPVQWIEDPDEWRSDDLEPEIEGMVILGVDEPILDDAGALVPVSLWCGGTCGTWFIYRLELVDGVWEVTGIEGPIAIS